jgi:hypothetical protein
MTHEELDEIQPSPEPWTIPLPPEIEFLVPQRKAWTQIPKTINQTNNSEYSKQKSSSQNTFLERKP